MSRYIQIKALEQKIERLSAQLDYLHRIDDLEKNQEKALSANIETKAFSENKSGKLS